eukprot:scaffold10912_cov18-Tisochrysis_lutea.AAC.4
MCVCSLYCKFDTFHPAVELGLPVTRVINRVTLQQLLSDAVLQSFQLCLHKCKTSVRTAGADMDECMPEIMRISMQQCQQQHRGCMPQYLVSGMRRLNVPETNGLQSNQLAASLFMQNLAHVQRCVMSCACRHGGPDAIQSDCHVTSYHDTPNGVVAELEDGLAFFCKHAQKFRRVHHSASRLRRQRQAASICIPMKGIQAPCCRAHECTQGTLQLFVRLRMPPPCLACAPQCGKFGMCIVGSGLTSLRFADVGVPLTQLGCASAGRQGTVEGDVLVGTDGIWSKIRKQMVGDTPAHYSAYTVYTVGCCESSAALFPSEPLAEVALLPELVIEAASRA